MASKRRKVISDDMIGSADRVCACTAAVGDIIAAQNEARPGKRPLRKVMEGLKREKAGGRGKR